MVNRHPRFDGLDHEEVWGLFLSSDNTVISREMLSKGTLTQTSIDNRTVIKRACGPGGVSQF
jgi:DNA repair protein RadC